jgi:hypothetical protein
MQSLVVLAILVVIVCGCTHERADWYGDKRFTPEERAQIEQGVAWLYAHAERPTPTIAWGYDFAGQPELDKTIRRESLGDGNTIGRCTGWRTGGRKTIYLDPDLMRRGQLINVAAHEFAHCELEFDEDESSEGFMGPPVLRWTASEDIQCRLSPYCGLGDDPAR